jgi:hypothetical protein
VKEEGGSHLLTHHFDNSLWKALNSIYPESNWEPWKFRNRSRINMEVPMDINDYIKWMEDKYNIIEPQQWYGITMERFRDSPYGRKFLWKFGKSLATILGDQYPLERWDGNQWFLQSSSQSQKLLYHMVRSIIPTSIELEYQFSVPLSFRRNYRFDLWIPYHNCAIEYQGIQHFMEDKFIHLDDMMSHKNRDIAKEIDCNERHLSLHFFPFWFSLDFETIKNFLSKVRII